LVVWELLHKSGKEHLLWLAKETKQRSSKLSGSKPDLDNASANYSALKNNMKGETNETGR